MACKKIYIGADNEDIIVTITGAGEWPDYASIELRIVDRYLRTRAQYKYPDTTGFRPLDISTPEEIKFNLHGEDMAKLTPGGVFANVVLIKENAAFEDGFANKEVRSIYIGEASQ